MPEVKANGVTLHYDDTGPRDAPVIMLVMGLAAQMILWPDAMVAALVARGFRVIRFDNRDIGLSEKLDHLGTPKLPWLFLKARLGLRLRTPYSLDDMAADTVGLMDALGIAKAHIVGASMGGMIAQLVAANHSDRVLTLTSIMSTSGERDLPRPDPAILRLMMRKRPASDDRDALIAAGIAIYAAIGTPGSMTPEERRALVAATIDRGYTATGPARQMAAIVANGSRSAKLARIAVPTLVIHGALDRLVPPEGGRDTARRIPGAKLEIVDNMAHDLPPAALPKIVDLIATHASQAQAGE